MIQSQEASLDTKGSSVTGVALESWIFILIYQTVIGFGLSIGRRGDLG